MRKILLQIMPLAQDRALDLLRERERERERETDRQTDVFLVGL